jgi:hypothetical protein
LPRENMNEWDKDLYQKVDRYNLVPNLEQCLQCGKCTGNCFNKSRLCWKSPSLSPGKPTIISVVNAIPGICSWTRCSNSR